MASMPIRVLVVAALLAVCGPTNSQQIHNPPTEPTGPVVKLSLIAVDSKNKSVDEITKDDLRVVENKIEQKILSVERDERPTDIMISIDASSSFSSYLPPGIEAAKLIIKNLRSADEVAIMSFASGYYIDTVQDFTTNRELLLNSLSLIRTARGKRTAPTALFDAVNTAVDRLVKHKSGTDRRKVLIIVTDGQNGESKTKFDDLVELLQQTSIQVFALGLTEDWGSFSPALVEEANEVLKIFVAKGGGRLFWSKDNKQLQNAVEETVRGLDSSFLLTYRSSDNSRQEGFRKVQVKVVSAAKKKVITPQGYFFKGAANLSNKKP